MFNYIYNFIFGKKENKKELCLLCKHNESIQKEIRITILDQELTFNKSKLCKECTKEFFEKESVYCNHCNESIWPGEMYACYGPDGRIGIYHYTIDCSFCGSMVGAWKKDKLQELGLL